MANPLSALLGALLSRTILVGAVLVAMKALWEGAFVAAGGLVLALGFFIYLIVADPELLR